MTKHWPRRAGGKTPAQTALMLLRDLNTTRLTRDGFQGPLVEEALEIYDMDRGYSTRALKVERVARAIERKAKK